MKAKRIIALILELMLVMSLFGCFGAKYSVDYCGSENAFINAQSSYRAGSTVKLRFMIATDTDYSLTVDGKSVNPEMTKDGSEFVFRFKMPDHDIKVELSAKNSMVNTSGENENEDTFLYDYYSAAAGVVGDARYSEMTVNRSSDGTLYLNVYSGNSDTESHTSYTVSSALTDELNEIIEKNKIEKWNDEQGFCIDGAVRVFRFTDKNGKLIRVSSENMPEDGEKAFSEIRAVMSEYIIEENKIG